MSHTSSKGISVSAQARKRIYPDFGPLTGESQMGGAKKKSMAQMEKTQDQSDKKDEPAGGAKRGAKGKPVAEKRPRGLQAPDISDPKLLGEIQRMGAITPYTLASQFNLRLSVAKDLLEELERRRLVTFVGGNARIRIYQPAAA